jgi:hypothetical protein
VEQPLHLGLTSAAELQSQTIARPSSERSFESMKVSRVGLLGTLMAASSCVVGAGGSSAAVGEENDGDDNSDDGQYAGEQGQWVYTPLEHCVTADVLQGSHGDLSHKGYAAYAIDYQVPEGTTVAAARAGRVFDLYQDSDVGCAEPSCEDKDNYVTIDHGDGTLGRYRHLQQGGVMVSVGDRVARGQEIGRSGNTGLTTEPHLHLEVVDLLFHSLPVRFSDLPEESNGAVYPGMSVTSGNTPEPGPETINSSMCASDLFEHRGVILTTSLPCTFVELGRVYPISGRTWASSGRVQIAQYSNVRQDWTYQCVDANEAGHFEATVSWRPEEHQEGSYLMVSATDSLDCTSGLWESAVAIRFLP